MSKTSLPVLAQRINREHAAGETSTRKGLDHFRAAGTALILAHEQVEHGGWLPWLETNCPEISERRAQRYMKLARLVKSDVGTSETDWLEEQWRAICGNCGRSAEIKAETATDSATEAPASGDGESSAAPPADGKSTGTNSSTNPQTKPSNRKGRPRPSENGKKAWLYLAEDEFNHFTRKIKRPLAKLCEHFRASEAEMVLSAVDQLYRDVLGAEPDADQLKGGLSLPQTEEVAHAA